MLRISRKPFSKMFLHSLLTVSLLSSQTIWSLPLPSQLHASRGQLLEKMDLQNIVRSVGPRHRVVLPNNQQESVHYKPNLKLLGNVGIPAEYKELASHFPQLELVENAVTPHDGGNDPLHHSPEGKVDGALYGDTHILEDIKMNPRGRQSEDLETKENNKQKLRIRKAIANSGFRSQSGSSDESSSMQLSSSLRGIWDLLPPDIIDLPRVELTPEQMEEIAETGRLCTEDGECVYFSGGWGEACCPFG